MDIWMDGNGNKYLKWKKRGEEEVKQDDPENVTHDNQNGTHKEDIQPTGRRFFSLHIQNLWLCVVFSLSAQTSFESFCWPNNFFFVSVQVNVWLLFWVHSVRPKLDFRFMKLSPHTKNVHDDEHKLHANFHYVNYLLLLVAFFRGDFLCDN